MHSASFGAMAAARLRWEGGNPSGGGYGQGRALQGANLVPLRVWVWHHKTARSNPTVSSKALIGQLSCVKTDRQARQQVTGVHLTT